MMRRWSMALVLLAGCLPTLPDERTQQVASAPFTESRRAMPTQVQYAPATEQTSFRVVIAKDHLLDKNPQFGIRPYVTAIGSADPEIFHVGMNQIFITEGLVRQCQTENQLAAALAYEMGRIISERESTVGDDVRSPDRPLPIHLPIGANGYGREADPLNHIELARHEKQYPKQTKKLTRPNPQLIAREILERAGYQRTDFDAALPMLKNAERYQALEHQFKGTIKQADWRMP